MSLSERLDQLCWLVIRLTEEEKRNEDKENRHDFGHPVSDDADHVPESVPVHRRD